MNNDAKRFVKMFQPKFHLLVKYGQKLQTVRPIPKRMPERGDIISCRKWVDKPYRSKQEVLRESCINEVLPVEIRRDEVRVKNSRVDAGVFAKADGFVDFKEMESWFENTHGLPFKGILISWSEYHLDQEERDELVREKIESDAKYD